MTYECRIARRDFLINAGQAVQHFVRRTQLAIGLAFRTGMNPANPIIIPSQTTSREVETCRFILTIFMLSGITPKTPEAHYI